MENKQQKYLKTDKGKATHAKAVNKYQTTKVQLKILIESEMMDALNQTKPIGVSRQAYIKNIIQNHLDSILST